MRSSSWRRISVAAALGLAAVAGVAHADPPGRLELTFEARRGDGGSPVADVRHRLRHDGARYELRESWEGRGIYGLAGSIERASRGMVDANGLRPVEYVDKRRGRLRDAVHFDWSARTLRQQRRGEVRSAPLPDRASDPLAFFYEFAFGEPAPAGGKMAVVNGRRISHYIFQLAGRERLSTAAGDFDTLKLLREKPDGERAELWLATKRSFIPVRILIVEDDGSRLDLIVTRISH